jgi:hypothetical protein
MGSKFADKPEDLAYYVHALFLVLEQLPELLGGIADELAETIEGVVEEMRRAEMDLAEELCGFGSGREGT